jgi:hypothetical protein
VRFYEYRQSNASPLKYHLELSPQELERVKGLIMNIVKTTKDETISVDEVLCQSHLLRSVTSEQCWKQIHGDIVEWMTESTKFSPRSDCG